VSEPTDSNPCSNKKLFLDCCSVVLASDVDIQDLRRKLGDAMHSGDVVKIKICWNGKPTDAWVKPSNSSISYIGDPDIRVL
jgi:hypothetical protein